MPIVDIRGLFSSKSYDRKRTAFELGRTAHHFGFLYVTGHGVPGSAIDAAYAASRRFFQNSTEFKNRYYIGLSRNHRGYVPITEKGNYLDEKERFYESFDLALELPHDDPDYVRGNPLLGPNVWPDIDGFREPVAGYYNRMSRLGRVLTEAFEIYLGVPPGTLTGKMSKPIAQLRLLHYLQRGADRDQAGSNMGAHTDYECFTILHQNGPGLQVLNLANRWIDVEPLAGAFVINLGDLFEVWSAGHFRATAHRVVSDGRERFSMPYFVAADYHAVIEPLFDINKSLYRPFVAGQHLMRMLVRDFPYMRKRYQDINLPDTNMETRSVFEQRISEAEGKPGDLLPVPV